jgi:hypothetical protein
MSPDRNTWKLLLSRAITVLRMTGARAGSLPTMTLGGGTVLMFRYEHRLSKDIDLFLHDAQWLSMFSPRLNDDIAAKVKDYEEQANTLKLVFSEGDVDIIVAGNVTDARPNDSLKRDDMIFLLESSEEIVAKKIYFRAASFRERDLFDLATLIEKDRDAASRALSAASPKIAMLEARISGMDLSDDDGLSRLILPLAGHEDRLSTMRETALAALLEFK